MLRPHPHFDDRGTLDWETNWRAAEARARSESKPIFIDFGREACSQCKSLVEAVLPRPDIGPLLAEHFVVLAADCDDPEPEVEELAAKLEGAMMLPFVILVDSAGQFLTGTSGAVHPGELEQMLRRALA